MGLDLSRFIALGLSILLAACAPAGGVLPVGSKKDPEASGTKLTLSPETASIVMSEGTTQSIGLVSPIEAPEAGELKWSLEPISSGAELSRFQTVSGTGKIALGQKRFSVVLTALQDSIVQGSVQYQVTISSALLLEPVKLTITLDDDDTAATPTPVPTATPTPAPTATPTPAPTATPTPAPSLAAPPVPREFHVTLSSSNYIDLSWNGQGGTTAGYQLAYAPGVTPPSDCASGDVITSDAISGTFVRVSGLSSGTRYAARLCAINSESTLSTTGVTLTFGTTGYCSAYSAASHYNQIGGDGTANNPYLICTKAQLDKVRSDCNSSNSTACAFSFLLMDNIDYGGQTISPIGNCCSGNNVYRGIFDGGSYAISNFGVNSQWAGLFQHIGVTGSLRNLRLVNISARGQNAAGVVGRNDGVMTGIVVHGLSSVATDSEAGGVVSSNYGTVTNVIVTELDMRASGSATRLGGLIARNYGTLSDSSIAGSFSASNNNGQETGTAVGSNESTGVINRVRSDVAVTHHGGPNIFGGFVGINSGTITLSKYTGALSILGQWKQNVGGFVGQNQGTIQRCSVTSSVNASAGMGGVQIGGFVGNNASSGTIEDSVSTGTASTGQYGSAGGFAGSSNGTLTRNFSTGQASVVSGTAGGFIGSSPGGSRSGNFWDVTTSGLSNASPSGSVSGATGATTSQMKTQSTFTSAGWNFTTIWTLLSGAYPSLIGLP